MRLAAASILGGVRVGGVDRILNLLLDAADVVLEDLGHEVAAGLVNVDVVLGRRLEPSNEALVLAVLVHLSGVLDETLLGKIALLTKKKVALVECQETATLNALSGSQKIQPGCAKSKIIINMHENQTTHLVGQKDDRDRLAVGQYDLGVNVILPLGDGLERGHPRHVKDDQGADSLLVVNAGHVAKALLTCQAEMHSLDHEDGNNCE